MCRKIRNPVAYIEERNSTIKSFDTDKKKNLLFVFAILAAGVIVYFTSFDCSFHFDDRNILNSSIAKSPANINHWIRLFPSRPLGILTFAVNYNIHGLDVRGYHLVNLMIHLINALLIWWLTWITLSTPAMKEAPISGNKSTFAFLTGLLFVTHPLATQSVTYIVQRFASLATLFYLLALILFIKGRLQENKNTALLLFVVSVLSGVCGILTKEIVFTLPFAVVLYDYCFIRTSSWKPALKDKSIMISFVLLTAFTLFFLKYYSLNIFNTIGPDQGYSHSISMKEYFLTQFRVLLTYIRLFFLPFNQNLDYDYPLSKSFLEMKTLLSFLALSGIVLTGILLFKKYRLISFGILWFFLTISVESSIVPISQNVIFEHRTYLPGFGFFIAFISAFFYFFSQKHLKIAVAILLVFAAVNSCLTYQRNKIWKNEYTLWNDCLKKSPDKARVNNERGAALADLGLYEQAIGDFDKAIRLNRNFDKAYYNRGTAYGKLGQYKKTIEDCNAAIRLKPDYIEAYNNRGNAYAELGLYQSAIENYSEAIRLMPDYFPVYVNRGDVYTRIFQYQKAMEDFDRAIDLNPDYPRAYNNRAKVYFKLSSEKNACRDLYKACELGNCRTLELANARGYCR
ncbi:MAG: tetratricopeptide repeat protein [Smithella sp.]